MLRQMLLGLLTLAPSCAMTGVGAECLAWRPILVADSDVISDQTALDILSHNLTGRRLCGW